MKIPARGSKKMRAGWANLREVTASRLHKKRALKEPLAMPVRRARLVQVPA
jgi:hypothetical protein